MDLVEVLGFIFMLSTMELGRVIPFFLMGRNQIILIPNNSGILDGESQWYTEGYA